MCPGQPWPLFLLLMAAMSGLWLIKHPWRSGSHGGWCHLSSGSCVAEYGRLQSLSLTVINSAVASGARKDMADGIGSSENKIKSVYGNQAGAGGISGPSPRMKQCTRLYAAPEARNNGGQCCASEGHFQGQRTTLTTAILSNTYRPLGTSDWRPTPTFSKYCNA